MAYFESADDPINLGSAAAALATTLMIVRNDSARAIEVALPHWDALQGVRGAEPVLARLARAIVGARTNRNEDSTDVVVALIALGERMGDTAVIAEALNHLASIHLQKSPVYAGILLRGAIETARSIHLAAQAGRGLLHLALLTAQTDLSESDALLAQAEEETRQGAGGQYFATMVVLNRCGVDVMRGAWDRAEQAIGSLSDSPIFAAAARRFVDATLAHGRGRPCRLSLSDEVRSIDDDSVLSMVAGGDMFEARARGDIGAAAAKGLEAVRHQVRVNGLYDDAIHMWPGAMEAALVAGEQAALDELLKIVDDARGLAGLGFRMHRARFLGLIAIRDGRTDDAEQSLREAIAGLEKWGSPPYAAKARAELAGWLDQQGRADEAAVLRQAALEVLLPLRADGWLTELGLERPADALNFS
jgi:tetratricopeptide (TPR) repeat protein